MKLARLFKNSVMFSVLSAFVWVMPAEAASRESIFRCYYQDGNGSADNSVNNVVAYNRSAMKIYQVTGTMRYLSSVNFLAGSMFYADQSYADLLRMCQDTLKMLKKPRDVLDIRVPVYIDSERMGTIPAKADYPVWTKEASVPGRINRVIAFGDSLTDNQNMFTASKGFVPNSRSWLHGRFTNGPVWAETVARKLGLPLVNWAIGGAGTQDNFYTLLQGLGSQIDSFKSYMKLDPAFKPEQTLFTVMVGGNDFVNYDVLASVALDNLGAGLRKLADAGARNILLMNLPDLTLAPRYSQSQGLANMDVNSIRVRNRLQEYNAALPGIVSKLEGDYPGLKIGLFDTHKLVGDVFANPGSYGIKNKFDACLDMSEEDKNYSGYHPVSAGCTNPDTYMFWDTLHPTAKLHSIMAGKVLDFALTTWPALKKAMR